MDDSAEAFYEISLVRLDLEEACERVERLRSENAELQARLSSTIAREQSLSSLLGMAEGVLAKADEVVTAHHAEACTPALVARLECGILRFRAVKAKDLPPAGLVS